MSTSQQSTTQTQSATGTKRSRVDDYTQDSQDSPEATRPFVELNYTDSAQENSTLKKFEDDMSINMTAMRDSRPLDLKKLEENRRDFIVYMHSYEDPEVDRFRKELANLTEYAKCSSGV
ncbi:uncharacterized protein I206_101126 [Kwoniella pini CBS 10737]|uniref:Uncharacterized protein n=1 Tax=Kwoniella pini CBS 10737 TaxID=1296096 RepID=A0A1B9IBD8_9TREE|nr:uncharacterized protein I206_00200 [Kwoniella pini CBS 10737]OCF52899.1 hypothetical protein I206_00200 [Kwoniella pini CBS 10737]